jgi:lipopolysaccharide/colanic/teichoic acid biosynthesis glycosyltransferase
VAQLIDVDQSVSRSSPQPLSTWNRSTGKRAFDLTVAVASLAVVLPLMLVIAVIVKWTSPGPVFFKQTRVGQGGRLFKIVKFRSMALRSDAGVKLTAAGDNRVTPVGRCLRKLKLDELPQLLNVLAGDMSLVGPRPDVPEYIRALNGDLSQLLQLRPGITGWASLQFRNEEEQLRHVAPEELVNYYVTRILPEKASLDLHYARNATLFSDLVVIGRTALTLPA